MKHIQQYARLVETELAQLELLNHPKELYDPQYYILGLKAKRLRPALLLAAYKLCGHDPADAIKPALGIELFHTFSLIHDDIMDEAPLRRGHETVHKKWNTNIAILSGDSMLIQAYQLIAMAQKNIPEVLELFSTTAHEVCEGQQMDMNFESTEEVSAEDYLEMIRLKTSVLLGCALKMGALLAGADTKQAQLLYDFGVDTGIAFQIQDDLLDSFGKPEDIGKQSGGDILQDKKTLLLIEAKDTDSDVYLTALEGFDTNLDKINYYKQWFQTSGARQKAEQTRDQYLQKALKALDQVKGDIKLKAELREFALWLTQRNH